MFPHVFRGHSFSVFRIIWRIFSVSFHSSSNLWSESPGPGTPWWRPFARAQHRPHFLFSLSSSCNRHKQSRIWQLEGMLQTIVKAVTLLFFISADKWYYLLRNAESGAGAVLALVEKKRHLASVLTVNQQLAWPLQGLDNLFSLIKAFPLMRLWVWI